MSGLQAEKPLDNNMEREILCLEGVKNIEEIKSFGVRYDYPEKDEYGMDDAVYPLTDKEIRDIGKYLRRLCDYQGVEIVEAEACPDHIHMLVKIQPKLSVSKFMGYLKGKSSLMIFEEQANLKYNYGNRHFLAEGYYVSTVGLNKNTIKKYIQNQELDDQLKDKRSLKEYKDPFTGK